MKTTAKILVTTLTLGLTTSLLVAQDERPPRPEGRPPQEGGPGGPGGPRMMPPLMAALDANRDGIIDEKEIANASAALKKLDKNGDGQLTAEEIRGPRMGPGGPNGPGGRPPGQGTRPPPPPAQPE